MQHSIIQEDEIASNKQTINWQPTLVFEEEEEEDNYYTKSVAST